MSKRSTNLAWRKSNTTHSNPLLDLMQWVGMSDDEIRAAVEREKAQAAAKGKQQNASADAAAKEGRE